MRRFISKLINQTIGLGCYVLVLALCACDVHQFPGEEIEPEPIMMPFTLSLDFDTTMPLYTIVEHQASRSDMSDEYDVRYIVNAYRKDVIRTDERQETFQLVVSKDDISDLNHNIYMEVEEGVYVFRVWSDYVIESMEKDLYYNTSDFANICLQGEHCGNTDYRDAFIGELEVEINSTRSQATVNMSRPLAKFNFISTDLEQFIEHVLELRAEAEKKSENNTQNEHQESSHNASSIASDQDGYDSSIGNDSSSGNSDTTQESDAESGLGKTVTRGVDMADFKVIFKYASNMPSAFNMFTGKPSDILANVQFESKLNKLNDHEAELGFDYVFVNGAESIVQVAIEVYDKDGTKLSSTDPFDVPLKRGMLTTIRAEFLTSQADGGVGIVPEFDGEYNYKAN